LKTREKELRLKRVKLHYALVENLKITYTSPKQYSKNYDLVPFALPSRYRSVTVPLPLALPYRYRYTVTVIDRRPPLQTVTVTVTLPLPYRYRYSTVPDRS
jgi:hypothetical protein